MRVKELIELLQKERPTKKIYLSTEYALVDLKKENVVIYGWGVKIG